MMRLPVYLDHNATTPCDPRVVEAMLPYFTETFGNAASRSHAFGWAAEAAVDLARQQVAALIGSEPGEIVFTSGATEANNLAIKGVFEAYASKGNHIITVATEHKAVLDTCQHVERLGGEVTYLPVGPNGLIDMLALEAAIQPKTVLIAVMYANNETGVLQPVRAIGRLAKQHGVVFFCDAAQAVGKVPVNVVEDGIDLLALSGHKIYGPKGVGALYVRRRDPRVRVTAQMDGGGHERGRRSGTLNVPAIVGLGKASEIARMEMASDGERMALLRDRLEAGLMILPEVYVNGNRDHRLPQTTNLSFRFTEGQGLMMGTNKDIAVSSGSACTSAVVEPSYVLSAMGLSDEMAGASLRFGLGRWTTVEEVDYAISRLSDAITGHRANSPAWTEFLANKR